MTVKPLESLVISGVMSGKLSLDVSADQGLVVVQNGQPFHPLIETREPRRKSRPHTSRSLHGVGELGRVGCREYDHRTLLLALHLVGSADSHRRMWVDQLPRTFVNLANGLDRLTVIAAPGGITGAQRRQHFLGHRQFPVAGKCEHGVL